MSLGLPPQSTERLFKLMHYLAAAAAGVGELVGHDVETVRLDLKHAIEATRRVRAGVTRDGLLS